LSFKNMMKEVLVATISLVEIYFLLRDLFDALNKGTVTGDQVINHNGRIASLNKLHHHVATDVPRAAGNKNFIHIII